MDINTDAPIRQESTVGQVLLQAGKAAEALPYLLRDAEQEPSHWGHLLNVGIAYRIVGRFYEAESYLRQAAIIAPKEYSVWRSIGILLDDLGQFDQSLEAYKLAFTFEPASQGNCLALGTALLRLGAWERAWPLWEYGRFGQSWVVPPKGTPWQGEDLRGKSIVVMKEGGYGDTFLYFRYLEHLRERGAKISVWLWDRQASLFRVHPWVDELLPTSKLFPAENYDYCTAMMSLPAILNAKPEEVPPIKFPAMAEKRVVKAFSEILPKNGKPKVGICWKAEEFGIPRKFRSVPEDEIEPLKDCPVHWVSLSPGKCPAWMADYTELLETWADTAGLVANLDLVISVDSAVLHLAGQLGKSTWGLIPLNSDFKWALGTDLTPWYVNVKLYRNEDPLFWKGTIDRVVKELS